LDRILERGQRVWLVRAQPAASDVHRGVERYLVERAYKIDEMRFGNWSRLMLFLPPEGEVVSSKTLHMIQGDEVRLAGYAIRLDAEGDEPASLTISPDAWMELSLNWQAVQAMSSDYTVFVQLLDEGNHVIWQKDRYPGDGVFPTSQWKIGKTIPDNYAFPLDLSPGSYRLIAGMYDWTTMDRLMWWNEDMVLLADLEVQKPAQGLANILLLSISLDSSMEIKHQYLPLFPANSAP
jgi:hypothetical protein